MPKIAFLGAGNMASAFVEGLLNFVQVVKQCLTRKFCQSQNRVIGHEWVRLRRVDSPQLVSCDDCGDSWVPELSIDALPRSEDALNLPFNLVSHYVNPMLGEPKCNTVFPVNIGDKQAI